jgi:CspA family cold shock protein
MGFVRDNPDGPLFFEYLDTVIAEGRAVVRSGRTLDYYRAIRDACRQHLRPYRDDPQAMAEILGWAARLMRFYAVADKLGKPTRPPTAVIPKVRRKGPQVTGARRRGTVKWFNTSKRYGFIAPEGGGDDVFVHLSQVAEGGALRQGQRVSFVMGTGRKGRPQAQDVRPE